MLGMIWGTHRKNIKGELEGLNIHFAFDLPAYIQSELKKFDAKDYYDGSRKFLDYMVINGAIFLVGDDMKVYMLNRTIRNDGKEALLLIKYWHACKEDIKCHVNYVEGVCFCSYCNRVVEESEIDIRFSKTLYG